MTTNLSSETIPSELSLLLHTVLRVWSHVVICLGLAVRLYKFSPHSKAAMHMKEIIPVN